MNVRLVKVYKNGGTERLNYKKNEKTTIVIKIWLLRESLRIFQETIKIVVGFEGFFKMFLRKRRNYSE